MKSLIHPDLVSNQLWFDSLAMHAFMVMHPFLVVLNGYVYSLPHLLLHVLFCYYIYSDHPSEDSVGRDRRRSDGGGGDEAAEDGGPSPFQMKIDTFKVTAASATIGMHEWLDGWMDGWMDG